MVIKWFGRLTATTVAVFALFQPLSSVAQLDEALIDRTVLPIPLAQFRGALAPTVEGSRAESEAPLALGAPEGAPNIFLVLLDDAGYGQTTTFGGLIQTPTLDSLAANGLRFTRFHVQAMCSPTRASLLTGRNSHAVGMGRISNFTSVFPGYNAMIPNSAALISETLRANGYSTAAIGKWHLTTTRELTAAGPFDRWPTYQGFDHFWGFMAAETDQWNPQLTKGTQPTDLVVPPGRENDYTLNEAMADEAIGWIRTHSSVSPNKPFFVYYAPGAPHAPLQAPKIWIDRFEGEFSMGWDRYREIVLERQKKQGVVPANTILTPRPSEIPAWDSLTSSEKASQERLMEVYAGFMAQTDHEIGRVIDTIREIGRLDNTIVIYISGDNGASMEGALHGTTNTMAQINKVPETVEDRLQHLSYLGGAETTPMYSAGWAWAGNTPFKWGKRIGSHLGGTRNGMVVSWPDRIKDAGAVRYQYSHVTDIAPTLLEAAHLPQPVSVNGVMQQPIDGQSLLASIDDVSSPSSHMTQYYEMLGNVAIYHDGWIGTRRTGQVPWTYGRGKNKDFVDLPWELYDLENDYSQANDVAHQYPEKLQELQVLFDAEARKNNVYPISKGWGTSGKRSQRPPFRATYYGNTRLYDWPSLENRSYIITAYVDVPEQAGDGVIVSAGGNSGGFSLYVKNGHVTYTYNYFQKHVTTIVDPEPIGSGKARISLELQIENGAPGAAANVVLLVNGKAVGQSRLPKTAPGKFSYEDTFDIGEDSGSPVAGYRAPFSYGGNIIKVELDVGPGGW